MPANNHITPDVTNYQLSIDNYQLPQEVQPPAWMSATQRYGYRAELWAAQQLANLGYQTRLISRYTANFDIIINDLLLTEVKISRARLKTIRPGYTRPIWQFDTSRLPRHLDSLLILICDTTPAGQPTNPDHWFPYVAPGWFAAQSAVISSHPEHYSGRYARYLHAWPTVAHQLHIRRIFTSQLLLPIIGQEVAA